MLSFRDYMELFEDLREILKAQPLHLEELRKMSQAMNEGFQRLTETIEREKAEVVSELKKLRDEIEQGKLNEAQIKQRFDAAIGHVEGIHTPAVEPGPGPDPIP